MNGENQQDGETLDNSEQLTDTASEAINEVASGKRKATDSLLQGLPDFTNEEIIAEAMDKVVDIYSAKDLKYRDSRHPISLSQNLHYGIISPRNSHLFKGELSLAENIQSARQFTEEEANYRESVNNGSYHRTEFEEYEDSKKFAASANVYYPEGVLKIAAKYLSEEDRDESELSTSDEYTKLILLVFVETIKGITDKETAHAMCKIFMNRFPKLLESSDHILSSSQCDDYSNTLSVESERKARAYFFANYEEIRTAWLESFFKESMSSKLVRGGMVNYRPDFGFILGPNAKVRSSFSYDYQTQATILSLNNRRHITGIFINEDQSARDMSLPEFPDASKGTEVEGDQGTQLRKIHFEISPSNAPQIFWRSIEGIPKKLLGEMVSSDPILSKLVLEVSSLEEGYRMANDKASVSRFDSRISEYSNEEKADAKKLEKQSSEAYEKCDKRKKNLSEEEMSAIYDAVLKYTDEFTPFKNGQSVWDMIVSLGEYHHLPVYNFKGDLLWPEEMSHGEVKEFVAEQDE